MTSKPPKSSKAKDANLPPPSGAPVLSGNAKASGATPDPEILDMETLGQLLEMDDGDEDHSFSKPLIEEYIEQADQTLKDVKNDMADASKSRKARLDSLSSKGHFLKGSSAALGVIKVRDQCESLQNLGKLKTADGSGDVTEDQAWEQCTEILSTVQQNHEQATKALKDLCGL